MKRIALLILFGMFMAGCGSHKYYHPTPNAVLFHDAGEVHVTGEASTSGLAAKASVSLPKNIGIIAQYKGGALRYGAHEAEIGVGYYTQADPRGLFVLGGMGFGSNREFTDDSYTTLKYRGRFVRPFAQINMGIEGGSIGSVIKGDIIASFKLERFYYTGEFLDGTGDPINSSYTLIEPAFVYGLGTNGFRFYMSVGFPFRPSFETLSDRGNARTFPATMGVGLRFIFGRKNEKKSNKR